MRLSTAADRDEARGIEVLHAALDAGVTLFDTANAYCLDATEPDTVVAFQQYRSADDASAFLQTDAYLAYEREVAPLLAGPPVVTRLEPVWTKPVG